MDRDAFLAIMHLRKQGFADFAARLEINYAFPDRRYDPSVASVHVGEYVLLKLIQLLIAEGGIKRKRHLKAVFPSPG